MPSINEDPKSLNGSNSQWVSDLMNKARKTNPSVTDTAFQSIESLLNGQLSERNLTATNRKKIARQLLQEMAPESPRSEEE